jgi:hypothetical protein
MGPWDRRAVPQADGGGSVREASGEGKTKGLSRSQEPNNDAQPANTLVIMHVLLLSGSFQPARRPARLVL